MIGFRCAPGAEDPLETGAISSAGFREKNNQILSVLLHSEIIHKSYNNIYVYIYIYNWLLNVIVIQRMRAMLIGGSIIPDRSYMAIIKILFVF